MLDLRQIDNTWTLFLDRDGVINEEKKDSYIFHFGEFVFYDRAKEALKILSDTFGKIVVVTNQRGIGKGMMTADDLTATRGISTSTKGNRTLTQLASLTLIPSCVRYVCAVPESDSRRAVMIGEKSPLHSLTRGTVALERLRYLL